MRLALFINILSPLLTYAFSILFCVKTVNKKKKCSRVIENT